MLSAGQLGASLFAETCTQNALSSSGPQLDFFVQVRLQCCAPATVCA